MYLAIAANEVYFCDYCRKMSKRFCERPFTLHRQQLEKYKQHFDVAPHGKISADAHGNGFGAILTKVCQSLLCAILLYGASASSG